MAFVLEINGEKMPGIQHSARLTYRYLTLSEALLFKQQITQIVLIKTKQ